ncbi:DUF861 domain-containing protein [Rhizobium sp. P38BS-XIX]|uniref:cupin domain-containing protein n=1 Tax=Rhizobium sp. P38BS-XIX TaxID=2726740 RepID=UPI0014564737|nr:cupin domain-containing protein [Rhizobium sp. P38BS-XIX]NLR97371.1 DUF861 domain-containing protein [Rhizobium sp. P38BS-XIX]
MASSPQHVVSFTDKVIEPAEIVTSDPAVVDRPYHARSWRYFARPELGAAAGIWEAEPHLERVACDYDEFCHLLEGTVRLTDSQSVSRTFGPGDSFVVSAGFQGTWENLTHVRKIFFILR